MKWPQWLEAVAVYVAIPAALIAGLAASYGRELEAKRQPDRHWWIRRLLVMPVLAITATAASNLFGFSASAAAFTAAMLSLGGYDALCLIEIKWRHRLESLSPASKRPEDGSAADDSAAPR